MEAFMSSLRLNPLVEMSSIKYTDTNSMGFELVAASPLKTGQTLLSLPFNLVLSHFDAWESALGQSLEAVFPHPRSHDDHQTIIKLVLISEKLGLESTNGSWSLYANSLPTTYSDPLWWTNEELALLSGTNLIHAVIKRTDELKVTLSRIHKVLDASVFTWERFLWAHSAFHSRCFPTELVRTVEGAESMIGCMVPLLDLGNHDVDFGHTKWEARGDRIVLIAERCFDENEPVRISYGKKANEQLLCLYGFTVPGNPYNKVRVKLGFDFDSLTSVQRSFFDKFIATQDGKSVFSNDDGPSMAIVVKDIVEDIETLKVALRTLLMSEHEMNQDCGRVISIQNEQAMLLQVKRLLWSKLVQSQAMDTPVVSINAENAAEYRKGQFEILMQSYNRASVDQSSYSATLTSTPVFTCESPLLNMTVGTEAIPISHSILEVELEALVTLDKVFAEYPRLAEFEADFELIFQLYVLLESVSSSTNWVKSLPATLHHTMCWNEQERSCLQGTPAGQEAEMVIEQHQFCFEDLVPQLVQAMPEMFDEEAITWDRFIWAAMVAESFTSTLLGEDSPCLIPLPCLPGHSTSSPNSYFDIDYSKQVLRIVAGRDLVPQELVTCSFAGRSATNAELLWRYGIVEPENPCDNLSTTPQQVLDHNMQVLSSMDAGDPRICLATAYYSQAQAICQ